ncbi:MAG: Crp/Fnr family transcriptional regulator [Endomicrobia bacterium]|nr:Crp/Fnr family transcriptional regulator [Endomicrobiia bacterium]
MKEYIKVISKCHVFDGMSDADIESVLSHIKPKIYRYKKGSYITIESDPVTDIFIVLHGCVQLIREDTSGTRSLIAQYTSGDSFFEACASVNMQSPVSSYASADSVIMIIEFENIINLPRALTKFSSKIIKNLLSITVCKLYNTYIHLIHVSKHEIRRKIFAYLISQKNKAGANEFVIPVSKTDLADYLFINRSAMTRELAAMKKDKLISFKGRKFAIITEKRYV